VPEPGRRELKRKLRDYLDARIAFYDARLDRHNIQLQSARAKQLEDEIWARALRAAEQASDQRILLFVLPALNEMFDMKIAREASVRTHVPLMIFLFLGLLSFACAFVAGMNLASAEHPSRLHVYLFAGTMAFTAFIVLNVEFPRAGFMVGALSRRCTDRCTGQPYLTEGAAIGPYPRPLRGLESAESLEILARLAA
jgi:hypothetical protein